MNEFVDECRREWRRLGVPDAVASEMADDLAADLEEAAAEGASAEDVLGSSSADPHSFAAAWAAERGVAGRAPRARAHLRRVRAAAAIGMVALAVTVVGAVLVIFDAQSDPQALELRGGPEPGQFRVLPPDTRAHAPQPAPMTFAVDGRVVSLALPPSPAQIAVVGLDQSDANSRTFGPILLVMGLAAAVPAMLCLFWLGSARAHTPARVLL